MVNNKLTEIVREVILQENKEIRWPAKFQNARTGSFFKPQNELVQQHIFETDTPRHLYIMSGEGAGKTATASVMALNKLRRGMSGAIICVDLPMLIKVWDEIKQWIPWECVISEHQRFKNPAWKPFGLFEIVFYAETGGFSKVTIGGLGDTYSKWEALNINWAYLDEARSMPKEGVIKIITGRIRVPGPNGEPPQLIVASTPTDVGHWMFRWFGPVQENDPLLAFKEQSKVITLSTEANLENLYEGYWEDRGLALTDAEKEVYVLGKWGHLHDENNFLEDIALWERLYDPSIPQISLINKERDVIQDAIDLLPEQSTVKKEERWGEMMVLGLDGGIKHDYFAVTGVTRNPFRRDDVVIRIAKEFKPGGSSVDFNAVEEYIRELCVMYNIITIVYDPYQLYMMAENLRKSGVAWLQEFDQGKKRLLADTFLYEYILQKRVAYNVQVDGEDFTALRQHALNAAVKYDADERKKRIIKKHPSARVDLLVSLSMSNFELARLNI